jgi:hypothetical protein
LYVDDSFLTDAKKLIVGCKEAMGDEFEMDIDMTHYFLGFEVWQRYGRFSLGKVSMQLRS